eukprot:4881445-Prymnesium_polylepis.1
MERAGRRVEAAPPAAASAAPAAPAREKERGACGRRCGGDGGKGVCGRRRCGGGRKGERVGGGAVV